MKRLMEAARGVRDLVGVLVGSAWRAAPRLFLTTFAIMTVGAVASVAYTLGFRTIIDAAANHNRDEIIEGVVLIAVLFSLSWTCGILGASRSSLLTDRVNLEFGIRIGRLTAEIPTITHLEHGTGLDRIEQLRNSRRQLAASPRQLMGIWTVMVRGIAIVVLLATVYPPVLVVPAFALAPVLAGRRAGRLQQQFDDSASEDRRLLNELFWLATSPGPAKELRTYGVAHDLAERHAELGEALRKRTVAAALRAALWEAVGWLAFAFGFVAAIVVLVLRAAHGNVSPGGVVTSISLMRRAQTQVSRGTDTAGSFGGSLRSARQLLWLEEMAREAKRPASAAESGTPVPNGLAEGIRLDGVAFSYTGAEKAALDGVDLLLPAGKTVALVGENGAGKSTLVKLLTGMYVPSAGRVLVDGVDLRAIATADWRERTTATFQDHMQFQLSAQRAVGLGDVPRLDEAEAVERALAQAGGGEFVAGLPKGLDTHLGKAFPGGHNLSGGQWQRVALARGVMREQPLLIVLDEPTAALDAQAEHELFERWAAAARAGAAAGGAITLLVTHRFSTAQGADLIVVLDQGRVIESGSHAELMAAGGTYAELFTLQAGAYSA